MVTTKILIDTLNRHPMKLSPIEGKHGIVDEVCGEIMRTLIFRSSKSHMNSYYSYNNLNNTQDIEIGARDIKGDIDFLDLPYNIRKKVAELFSKMGVDSEVTNTDCLGMIKFVFGDIDISKGGLPSMDLVIVPADEILAGDIVFLQKEINGSYENEFHHGAIYLGKGLFLSKLGPDGGILAFNNHEQLTKLYNPDKVTILRKKSSN